MDCSTPAFPVLHYFLEFAQTHVHWVSDTIQPVTSFNLSLSFAIRSSWSEPQSAPGLVFADCIELLHLQLQRIWSIWFQWNVTCPWRTSSEAFFLYCLPPLPLQAPLESCTSLIVTLFVLSFFSSQHWAGALSLLCSSSCFRASRAPSNLLNTVWLKHGVWDCYWDMKQPASWRHSTTFVFPMVQAWTPS